MEKGIDFKANQERIRQRYQAKKLALKKQERKEFILFTFIATFILVLMTCVLFNMNEADLNSCMAKGYSETTCLRNL